MTEDWFTVEALFGRPGSHSLLGREGSSSWYRIDTGSDVTVVNSSFVQKIYGGIDIAYSVVRTLIVTGEKTDNSLFH